MSKVNFKIGDVLIESEWRDTVTANSLLEALPIESSGNYWGEEFYFDVPVVAAKERDAVEVVEPGTVAYWPAGHCLCLFWGPTPGSQGGECRAASAVNIVGRVLNPDALKQIRGRRVRVEAGEA